MIANCDGTAESMAETMQDNLAGQMQILKSQLEELAISFISVITVKSSGSSGSTGGRASRRVLLLCERRCLGYRDPVYIDGEMIDEIVLMAQQRMNLRSGGR